MNEQMIIIGICIIVFLVISLLIGVFVYRDAKEKGMNAVMWTVISLAAPILIGFILYLLVRGSYSDLKCPKCGMRVTEEFAICPKCGIKLKAVCPSCYRPVEDGWKACPWCTTSLEENCCDVLKPLRRKDRTLKKILVAVVIIPVLLLVAVVGYVHVTEKPSQIINGTGRTSVESYFRDNPDHQVLEWYERAKGDTGKGYALKYQRIVAGMKQTCILIYVPDSKLDDTVDGDIHFNGFESTLEFSLFSGTREEPREDFDQIVVTEEYFIDHIKLYRDGEELECEVTAVDFDPTTILSNIKNWEQSDRAAENTACSDRNRRCFYMKYKIKAFKSDRNSNFLIKCLQKSQIWYFLFCNYWV